MLLAHAGGWDELLIAAGAVLLVALPRLLRGTRARRAPASGPCAYCGHPLEADDARCPSCEFRALIVPPDEERGLREEAPQPEPDRAG